MLIIKGEEIIIEIKGDLTIIKEEIENIEEKIADLVRGPEKEIVAAILIEKDSKTRELIKFIIRKI